AHIGHDKAPVKFTDQRMSQHHGPEHQHTSGYEALHGSNPLPIRIALALSNKACDLRTISLRVFTSAMWITFSTRVGVSSGLSCSPRNNTAACSAVLHVQPIVAGAVIGTPYRLCRYAGHCLSCCILLS